MITYEVNMFSDASELTYGAITYLKLAFIDGTSTLSFLMEKSQLTSQDCIAAKICWSKDCSSH